MIDEELHLLLLLSLNKGIIKDDHVILKSKHLNKEKELSFNDIEKMALSIECTGEAIIDHFIGTIIDWDKDTVPERSASEKKRNIKNLYSRYFKDHRTIDEAQKCKLFFKFYSPTRPTGKLLREEIGRTWIDYEKQLKTSTIIHDDIGIWAIPECKLNETIFSQEMKNHYGNSIMVLSMIKNEEYFFIKEHEYIGSKYHVIHRQALSTIEDYIKFKDFLSKQPNRSIFQMTIDRVEIYPNTILI